MLQICIPREKEHTGAYHPTSVGCQTQDTIQTNKSQIIHQLFENY